MRVDFSPGEKMSHLTALWSVWKYFLYRPIPFASRLRLCKKATALYWCFLAFSDGRKDQYKRVADCALLSAQYDYDTDWVRVEHDERHQSESYRMLGVLLRDHPNMVRAIDVAMNLFAQDLANAIPGDGADRGGLALVFYWLVIDSQWMSNYREAHVWQLGRCLQLVDDIHDRPYDLRDNQRNAFVDEHCVNAIRELRAFLLSSFFQELAKRSMLYRLIRWTCQRKLIQLEAEMRQAAQQRR